MRKYLWMRRSVKWQWVDVKGRWEGAKGLIKCVKCRWRGIKGRCRGIADVLIGDGKALRATEAIKGEEEALIGDN